MEVFRLNIIHGYAYITLFICTSIYQKLYNTIHCITARNKSMSAYEISRCLPKINVILYNFIQNGETE